MPSLVLFILFLAPPEIAEMDDASPLELLLDQAISRRRILDEQRRESQTRTRQLALLAYRASLHRQARYVGSAPDRASLIRTHVGALWALRGIHEETRALAEEAEHARIEHTALEGAFLARALPSPNSSVAQTPRTLLFKRPVRGTLISLPGSRTDGSSNVLLRHVDLEWLGRLNDPVKSIERGTVARVEALPQGGFVVVIAHPDGYTSILSGLRDITAKPGMAVEAGQPIGILGRNLDGAAVCSLEIWRKRGPVEMSKLLSLRR